MQLISCTYLQTHLPRTKLHHLLMNSMASSVCWCKQVISLNSGKDQRQHILSRSLVMTSQGKVTDFTSKRERKCVQLSIQNQNQSHHFGLNHSKISSFFVIHKVFCFVFFKKTAPLSRYQQTMLLILLKVDTIYVIFKSKRHLIC